MESLSAQLHPRNVLIEQLKVQLAKLKRMKFGRSSEQLDAQIAQLDLSLEELEANAAVARCAPSAKMFLKSSTMCRSTGRYIAMCADPRQTLTAIAHPRIDDLLTFRCKRMHDFPSLSVAREIRE